MPNTKFNARYLTKVAMLTAIAVVLIYLEIPIPIFPAFLKIDLSDLPALLGGFALGPVAALIIQLLKNIIHFVIKNDASAGLGNLANFIVGCALAIPAAIIYKKNKNLKNAIIGMATGIASMVIISTLSNYFFILPAYFKLYGFDVVMGMSSEANEKIVDLNTLITCAIIPFNALKGAIVCIITGFIYKPLSKLLHK